VSKKYFLDRLYETDIHQSGMKLAEFTNIISDKL